MQSVPYYEKPPTYEHFLEHHLKPNLPALIGPELTAHWRARQEWVEPIDSDPEGPSYKPRFEFLREAFGEATAQVADCSERHFTDQKRSDMKFSDFVDVWQEGRYYLKDWHFCRAFPEYEAYTVPDIFADDWMNEFWLQGNKDDYRFVYMGGNGTFTPFHADVFRSYSWSSNICGIKKWTLFYPGQEHLLCDSLGNFPYDIRDIDTKQFPNFSKAKRIVLYQKDGETLFVPSGWFHQVENVGPTISINHNWSNACNLSFTYRSLQADLKSVQHSIEDLRNEMPHEEFVDTCQRLLLVHSGWDWTIFCQLLVCIARRLAEQTEAKLQPDPAWQVQRIQEVVADMKNCIDIEDYFKRHPDVCLQDIEQWLSHRRCCSSP